MQPNQLPKLFGWMVRVGLHHKHHLSGLNIMPTPKGGIIITTNELATAYGVTRRCINKDCLAGIYPYTRRVTDPKSHHKSYNIQNYIPFYSRQTWHNLCRNAPSTFGDDEREAILLAYGHFYSIRECCRKLCCDHKTIRALYDKLFKTGRLFTSATDPEEE